MRSVHVVASLTVALALGVLMTGQRAEAVQLGDTRATVESLHDTPPIADHQKGTATYSWDVWRLEIQYQNGIVSGLTYTKIDPMTNAEIFSLLDQNGTMARWHVTSPLNNRSGSWARDDGASAVFTQDASHKDILKIQGGRVTDSIAAAVPTSAPDRVLVSVPYKEGVTPPTPTPAPAVAPAANSAQPGANRPATNHSAPAQPAASAPKPPAATPGTITVPNPVTQPSATGERPAAITLPAPPVQRHWLPEPYTFLEPYLAPTPRNGIILGAALLVIALLVTLIAVARRAKGAAANRPFAGESGGPQGFGALTWRHFELLLSEVFRREGYAVESVSNRSGDGVDMRLRRDGALTLVQCKFWSNAKVSVQAVRDFYDTMTAAEAVQGFFICTGDYTLDALQFADGKPLQLLDREGLKDLIARVGNPGEDISVVARRLPQYAG